MNTRQLAGMREWFTGYVHGFKHDDGELLPVMVAKLRHSERVSVEAREIACDLNWSSSRTNAAEALGLVHDIGRFPQFAEYRTYSDAASVDHGEQGWVVAADSPRVLELSRAEREAILDGVRYHNRQDIPADLSSQSRAFLSLIRDADKLDILRLVLGAIEKDGFRDFTEMLPGISGERFCSPTVIEEMQNQRICSMQNVRSLGDFLLLQLSWVYDLNYTPTYRRFFNRRIVSRILRQLPGDSRIQKIATAASVFLVERLGLKKT